jgi:DNA-binding transcriptional MerR regulator/methylmalonyl-CoA mutase cobalamin-binding subunit
MEGAAQLRIGELARRTGIATELLRAWERRYGLLTPERTAAGYRLYSDDDVRRVRHMRELLAAGLSAAEAARQAGSEPGPTGGAGRAEVAPASGSTELRRALEHLDDADAHAAFDRLLADYSTAAVLSGVVLPLLRELGTGWERGEISVAQEHFASNLLRGRLLGLARGWDRGAGPRAVLACPPGERHDLGLVIFGLALRELGWRITFLGADTPADTIVESVQRLEPAALVLAVTDSARLAAVAETADGLADAGTVVWIGGAGAGPVAGARVLDGSPLEAAEQVAS